MGAYCIRHAGAHAGRESPERAPEGPIGPRGLRHPHRAYSTYGTHTGTYGYHTGYPTAPNNTPPDSTQDRTYRDYLPHGITWSHRGCQDMHRKRPKEG